MKFCNYFQTEFISLIKGTTKPLLLSQCYPENEVVNCFSELQLRLLLLILYKMFDSFK